jgi:hypothetical protein
MTRLILIFVRYRNTFLILERNAASLSFPQMWETLTMTEESASKEAVKEFICEQLGIPDTDITKLQEVTFIQKEHNDPAKMYFVAETTNPFLDLGWEYTAYEWITPNGLGKFETVPGLAEDLEKVKNY